MILRAFLALLGYSFDGSGGPGSGPLTTAGSPGIRVTPGPVDSPEAAFARLSHVMDAA